MSVPHIGLSFSVKWFITSLTKISETFGVTFQGGDDATTEHQSLKLWYAAAICLICLTAISAERNPSTVAVFDDTPVQMQPLSNRDRRFDEQHYQFCFLSLLKLKLVLQLWACDDGLDLDSFLLSNITSKYHDLGISTGVKLQFSNQRWFGMQTLPWSWIKPRWPWCQYRLMFNITWVFPVFHHQLSRRNNCKVVKSML